MKKLSLILGVVILVISVLLIVLKKDEEKVVSAEIVVEAYMEAIKGNDNELSEFGETNYNEELESYIEGLNLSEVQNTFLQTALSDFNYKVVEVKELENNYYEVVYEIDSYNMLVAYTQISQSLSEILSAEEYEAYSSSAVESEAFKSAQAKIDEEYEKRLSEIEPEVTKYSVIVEETENGYKLKDSEDKFNFVLQILGIN